MLFLFLTFLTQILKTEFLKKKSYNFLILIFLIFYLFTYTVGWIKNYGPGIRVLPDILTGSGSEL